MTHKVEVCYGDGTPVEGQGYTTSDKNTSGQVELLVNGKKVIVDTFDLFRGMKDMATCISFSNAVLPPAGIPVEHNATGKITTITIYKSGEKIGVAVPDRSHPVRPPIGIYITRL